MKKKKNDNFINVSRKEFNNLKANLFIKPYSLEDVNKDYMYYRYDNTNIYFLLGNDILYVRDYDNELFKLYFVGKLAILKFIAKHKNLLKSSEIS